MKKLFLLIVVGFCSMSMSPGTADISASFWAKYPRVGSSFCYDCTLEVNPYFSAITDEVNGYSKVTYANYTPAKEAAAISLKVSRADIGSWHAYPGDPNEDKYYVDINKGISNPLLKYAKGHYDAFSLCAWTIEGAVASDTYKVNEGLENQGQNQGTEFEVENLTRALVGSTAIEVKKAAYSGPVYARVDYWKGGWYDPAHPVYVSADNISRIFCDVYWNVLEYGGQIHAYWFPNNISASKGHDRFEIPFNTLVLRLGFDPTQVIKAAI